MARRGKDNDIRNLANFVDRDNTGSKMRWWLKLDISLKVMQLLASVLYSQTSV